MCDPTTISTVFVLAMVGGLIIGTEEKRKAVLEERVRNLGDDSQ